MELGSRQDAQLAEARALVTEARKALDQGDTARAKQLVERIRAVDAKRRRQRALDDFDAALKDFMTPDQPDKGRVGILGIRGG